MATGEQIAANLAPDGEWRHSSGGEAVAVAAQMLLDCDVDETVVEDVLEWAIGAMRNEYGDRIKDAVCRQCSKPFVLRWVDQIGGDTGGPVTLRIRDYPSGGIYDVRFKCPHCDYEEEL